MALDLPGWVVIAFNYAGLPWPGVDEDELRAWAASVRKFAGDVTDNSARTRGVAAGLADSQQSSFTAAMAARWEHHDRLIADLHEPLNVFADALDVAADVVVAQKMVVIGAAIAFATEFAATQVGAIFTLGADEAALPEEIISTREIVDFAIQELKGALIGELLNVAVQQISDHLSRVIGNLLSGGLQVVTEYQSLKISYNDLRGAASAMRGQARETEETGDSAYAENANRDLEDPGEGAADSGFASVVQAVKQALLDLCLGMFKNLPQVFAQIQQDSADDFDNAATAIQDADNASGHAAPHDDGHGPSADPAAGPVPVGPPTVESEPGLRVVASDPGAEVPQDAKVGGGDPVDVANGDVMVAAADVTLPGVLPLVLERTHRSSWRTGRWFGRSWLSTLDQRLLVTPGQVIGAFADGRVLTWTRPDRPGDEPVLPATGAAWPLRRDRDGCYAVTDPQRGLTWRFEHRAGYDNGPGDEGELPLVSLTDRIGHEIAFHYDLTGQPTSVTHSGGYRVKVAVTDGHVTTLTLVGRDDLLADVPLVSYEYDADANLSGVINSSGLPLRYGYDPAGRLTGWVDRNGHYYRYAYDSQGRCIRGEGPGGALSGTFSYEPGITRWTDHAGAVTTYEIAPSGRVAAITNPLGTVTRWEYDSHGDVTTRIDPLGLITRYAYDNRGNLIAITRPDGSQATAEYDERSLLTSLTGPDGATWRQEFDARGSRTALIAPDGNVTGFGYDTDGRLASITDPAGAVTRITTNAAGLPVAVTSPTGRLTRYARDQFGLVTQVTSPDGAVTGLSWSAEGRLTERLFPDGATESWTYDGEGNLISQLSAAGEMTVYGYGPFDRLTGITGPDGTRTEFGYDHQLRLTSVVYGGLTWQYDYDAGGRLTAETDYNAATKRYGYDPAGHVISKVNAASQQVIFRYDQLGNLTERVADGVVTTFEYDPAGRLVRAANPDADLRFEFDALGRTIAQTCNGRTVTSSYGPAGRLTRRATPSGAATAWEYDLDGQPVSLMADGHQIRFSYDLAGRETRRDLPGGLTLNQDWDQRGRLTLQALTAIAKPPAEGPAAAGRILQRRAYRYRPDGMVTGIDDLLAGNHTIGLDRAGRVTNVTGADWAEWYSYDQAGNVTAASWPVPPSAAATAWLRADVQGRREVTGTLINRAGSVRYRHDPQGRVIQRQRTRISRKPDVWRYDWDADNRLRSVTTPDGSTWRYLYDPLGRRIAKQHLSGDGNAAEQTDFTWDGVFLVEQAVVAAEVDRQEVLSWNHQPGTFTPLTQAEYRSVRDAPQEQVDERFYAIITDLAGTPTELTSADGTLAGHQRQTLWGGTSWDANGARTPLRFPGQYEDPESGLHYNNQRYYDPVVGTYLSPDPFGLLPSPNPHAYVPNPHVLIDPLGLESCRAASIATRVIERARAGTRRLLKPYKVGKGGYQGYHGDQHGFTPARELEILSNPDGVYLSQGGRGALIFHQGGDVVLAEGPAAGSRAGQLITSYGPSGTRGASGVAALGGSPGDPGEPITREQILNGTIPSSDDEPVPAAVEIFLDILSGNG